MCCGHECRFMSSSKEPRTSLNLAKFVFDFSTGVPRGGPLSKVGTICDAFSHTRAMLLIAEYALNLCCCQASMPVLGILAEQRGSKATTVEAKSLQQYFHVIALRMIIVLKSHQVVVVNVKVMAVAPNARQVAPPHWFHWSVSECSSLRCHRSDLGALSFLFQDGVPSEVGHQVSNSRTGGLL